VQTYPLLFLIWLLPLFGAVLIWAFGPQLKSFAGPIGSALVGVSFIAALCSWNDATLVSGSVQGAHQALVSWLPQFAFGLQWDRIALVWTLIITGVGFLIHVYSIGYMAGEHAFARFFAYLNFFVFAMLTLVLSDNFVGLLIGWGLVGLASYLLIGFYQERPSAVAASKKAFVINVVGDVGILYAVFVIVSKVGAIGYGAVFTHVNAFSPGELFAVCLGLFVGCAAKSAQVPLHTWLPDAMEGPTPVSALIHAATMVTAGVYLIARCAPLWNASSDARMMVGSIGALTAITGAILGCAQWDIKRILAYSTMSQIGYMIMAVGVGAFGAGILHFLTHAFFKALLFLTAGIVIHNLGNEQDVRKMGGLRKQMPFAFAAMTVGVLSICGIPGFAGYFSKDAVLTGTLAHGHPVMWAVGVLTAGLTAYYMFRMLFMTFLGAYRGNVDPSELGLRHPELAGTAAAEAPHSQAEHGTHAHAPAWLMSGPVALLMIPAVLIGWLDFGGDSSPWGKFFEPVFGTYTPTASTPPDVLTSLIVLVLIAAGITVAYMRYGNPRALLEAIPRLRNETVRMPAALTNAFYFDAAIEALFVKPAVALGSFFRKVIDPHVIDAGVREAAISSQWLGHLFRSFETGLVRAYALALAFGAACFAIYYVVIGVAR
jgi:NADH-quinone oxidoreductase subunit L